MDAVLNETCAIGQSLGFPVVVPRAADADTEGGAGHPMDPAIRSLAGVVPQAVRESVSQDVDPITADTPLGEPVPSAAGAAPAGVIGDGGD